MTVEKAIEELKKLPPTALLMVGSLGHGGSVPLQGFEDADKDETDPNYTHWIDVLFCNDDEMKPGGAFSAYAHLNKD